MIDLTGKYVRRFVRSGVDSWCEQVTEEDSDVPDNIKSKHSWKKAHEWRKDKCKYADAWAVPPSY